MRNVITDDDLFAAPPLPAGLEYRADFLGRGEESVLVRELATLPLREATFRQYTARRRVVRFGSDADPSPERQGADPMPAWLTALRHRAAIAARVGADDFVHVLVTEYRPGTPIGWHCDKPGYGTVVGISLGSACRMRFRPIDRRHERDAVITLCLAPRSLYVMRDDIRWRWQHQIPPVASLRYSITFRTPILGSEL